MRDYEFLKMNIKPIPVPGNYRYFQTAYVRLPDGSRTWRNTFVDLDRKRLVMMYMGKLVEVGVRGNNFFVLTRFN